MSSFSRFLKELPFLPKNFRAKQETSSNSPATADFTTGITINVYELEPNDGGSSDHSARADDDSDQSSITPKPDNFCERQICSAATSRMGATSAQQARYTNIVVFCRRCRNEISVQYLIQHRRRHEALDILKYSSDFPPKTLRGLVRKRNKAMAELIERGLSQEQVFYHTKKINIAFEILKAEVEGTEERNINISRWREKDIRTEGKIFNVGLLLGISRYRTPQRGLSIIKTVHIDNFLENRGIFFGMYQGYNGSYVANLCARELHKEIKEYLHGFGSNIRNNTEMVKSAFQDAYRKIDKIQLIAEGEHPWKRWSGCSAVTCLILNQILYVANEGSVRGFLVRENNTMRSITSSHDLYNRKERLRVTKRCGVIVQTEKCALVNGVLETTRGLGNQGDWRLKICVINKPRFRVLNLKLTDKMIVIASEGFWKVLSYEDALFILNKFIRDAVSKRRHYFGDNLSSSEEQGFLGPPPVKLDNEYRAFMKKQNVSPIDSGIPQFVKWKADKPHIVIRRATIMVEEPLLEQDETRNVAKKWYFTETEEDDEDLQQLFKLLNVFNLQSSYSKREIARLLSKRLLKTALIAGAETDNVVMVLLLEGFDVEEYKYKDAP